MPQITLHSQTGASAGTADLADAVFGVQPNVPVMHQVVTAQLAKARAGTQSTLTRAEVRGGGKKPWRQKGTGRARQGSIRSPQWRGGGVALGPKPRDYSQRTPKKMIQLALRSALSDRAADGKIVVVDNWSFTTPKTKDAVSALKSLGVSGKVLVVVTRDEDNASLSFRNVPDVHVLLTGELNAYDVLVSDWVVFSQAALPTGGPAADAPATDAAPAATPAATAPTVPDAENDALAEASAQSEATAAAPEANTAEEGAE